VRIGFVDEVSGVDDGKVDAKMDEIVLELRKRVPPLSVFPSENFVVPQNGEVVQLSPRLKL
jgi:hypothetical protein